MKVEGGNLIDQVPLLDCVFREGGQRSLPIGEALRLSHDIVGLIFDVPTMYPAVLRQLLLPMVLDALGSPPTLADWARRFEQGRFTEAELETLTDYLAQWSDRFDLFDPERPFGQVAGLHTAKNETRGAALLVATEPTGNNVPLFASRSEADVLKLSLAAAALWLLHTQAWDTAAIKTGVIGDPKTKGGKTSGNPTGPLGGLGVLFPVGVTLYDTLMLNSPVGVQDRLGVPQWRRDKKDPRWAGGPEWSEAYIPDGLLDLFTLHARRIRLFPQVTEDGVITVDRVIVAAGDRLRDGPPDWEPHTAWRMDRPKKTGAEPRAARPLRHAPGRAMWQGMTALLALEADAADVRTSEMIDQLSALEREQLLDRGYPLRVEAFGIEYGNQSAVVENVSSDGISLPVAALRGHGDAYDLIVEVTGQADELAAAVNQLSADLRRSLGADPIPWDKGQRPSEQLLCALDPLVRRLLTGVGADSDDPDKLERGHTAWEIMADRITRRTVEPLFDVPGSAFLGRTASNGNRDYSYQLGSAANRFEAKLRKILPRAAEARGGTT